MGESSRGSGIGGFSLVQVIVGMAVILGAIAGGVRMISQLTKAGFQASTRTAHAVLQSQIYLALSNPATCHQNLILAAPLLADEVNITRILDRDAAGTPSTVVDTA